MFESPAPLTDIDLPLDDRRDGRSVSCAPQRTPSVRHHRSPVGVRPGDRDCPYKGVLNQLWRGGPTRPATSSPITSCRARPERADRRNDPLTKSKWSSGVYHRRHRHRPVDAMRGRSPELCTATNSPTASRRTRVSTPIVTPTTKADHGGHDVHCRAPTSPTVASSIRLWDRVRALALALFERGRVCGELAGDPRRHEVRVRPHRRRRPVVDRRGAHTGLLALVGSLDVRQRVSGGDDGSLDKEVVRRSPIAATGEGPSRAVPHRLVGHHRSLSTPTNGSPATRSSPQLSPGRESPRCRSGVYQP